MGDLNSAQAHDALNAPELPERADAVEIFIEGMLEGEDEGQGKGAKDEIHG